MAIGTINSNYGNLYASYGNVNQTKKKQNGDAVNQAANTSSAKEASSAEKTEKSAGYISTLEEDQSVYTNGRTVGKPTLSKKAEAYYEKLQKKFGDMDFILVSADKKKEVEANAAAYANSKHTVVLIDEDKVEKMAADESYANKVEGQITAAKKQIPQLQQSLQAAGVSVKGFGIKINDNGAASFLATVNKSMKEQSKAQKERIAEKRADKKEAAKKAAKKAAKEAAEDKAAEKAASKKTDPADDTDETSSDDAVQDTQPEKGEVTASWNPEDTVTFSADNIDDLIRQVSTYQFNSLSNSVQTAAEKSIGQSVDYSA